MTTLLTDPIFSDPDKAREHLERLYWPSGPVCRHCGNADPARITKLAGKSTRPGTFWCNDCDAPFTVTVGTVMEDSHLPLNKWVLAFHLMASSKKGMSAHQLHRTLGVTYKTAWFLAHRIRESMADLEPNKTGGPLGGTDKVVEADETVVGGKSKNRAYHDPAPKKMVATLVERGGRVRSKHVKAINSKTLRPFVMKNVSRKSTLNTDEAAYYVKMGREFAKHHAVDHSRNENTLTSWTGSQLRSTAQRTISAFSREAFMASIILSARRTYTATLPSSISVTIIAQSLASRIPSALRKRCWVQKASD